MDRPSSVFLSVMTSYGKKSFFLRPTTDKHTDYDKRGRLSKIKKNKKTLFFSGRMKWYIPPPTSIFHCTYVSRIGDRLKSISLRKALPIHKSVEASHLVRTDVCVCPRLKKKNKEKISKIINKQLPFLSIRIITIVHIINYKTF